MVQHPMLTLTNHPTTNRPYYGGMYCRYYRFNAIYVNAVDTVVTTITLSYTDLIKRDVCVGSYLPSQNKICGVRIELIMYVNTVDTTLYKM